MIKPNFIWDETKADSIVWLSIKPKFIDHSILNAGAFSLDDFGISYDLMSVAAFTLFAGHAPMIRPAMVPAAGTGAVLVMWSHNNAMRILQEKCRFDQKNVFLEIIPERLLKPMRINRSLRERTLEYIFTTLDAQLGILAKSDFDYLTQQIKEKYTPLVTPTTFLAEWQTALGDLAQAGQPLSQITATDTLQTCFGPEFNDCWRNFVRQFPLVADRTVDRLCAAIIVFARDELPFLAAQMVIGINQVTNQTAQLAQMQDQIAELQQALVVSQAQSANRKRGGVLPAEPPVRAARPRRDEVPFAQRLFCWTHGPCHSHKGDACRGRDQGHKENASWANQMGSQWRTVYARRGWPIA